MREHVGIPVSIGTDPLRTLRGSGLRAPRAASSGRSGPATSATQARAGNGTARPSADAEVRNDQSGPATKAPPGRARHCSGSATAGGAQPASAWPGARSGGGLLGHRGRHPWRARTANGCQDGCTTGDAPASSTARSGHASTTTSTGPAGRPWRPLHPARLHPPRRVPRHVGGAVTASDASRPRDVLPRRQGSPDHSA